MNLSPPFSTSAAHTLRRPGAALATLLVSAALSTGCASTGGNILGFGPTTRPAGDAIQQSGLVDVAAKADLAVEAAVGVANRIDNSVSNIDATAQELMTLAPALAQLKDVIDAVRALGWQWGLIILAIMAATYWLPKGSLKIGGAILGGASAILAKWAAKQSK